MPLTLRNLCITSLSSCSSLAILEVSYQVNSTLHEQIVAGSVNSSCKHHQTRCLRNNPMFPICLRRKYGFIDQIFKVMCHLWLGVNNNNDNNLIFNAKSTFDLYSCFNRILQNFFKAGTVLKVP